MKLGKVGRLDEAARGSEALAARAESDDDRASLLTGALVFSARLGRLADARRILGRLMPLEVSDPEVRLNAEFCEPCLLIQEGRAEEAIAAFRKMLQLHHDALHEDRFRYLYEDIQCRTGLALVSVARFAEALPILREAVDFTSDKAAGEQEVRYALAVCYEETSDPEAAKHEYHAVIAFNAKSDFAERARYRVARIYMMTGGLAQARKLLDEVGLAERMEHYPVQLSGGEQQPGASPAVPRKRVYEHLSLVCRHLGDRANGKLYADLAKSARE